jgi:uncharacterized protein YkwD
MQRISCALVLLLAACGDDDSAGEPDAWPGAALEEQVLDLTNAARAAGGGCGDAGVFGPAPALTMEEHLRLAARRHSVDMGERAYFAHESPGGPYGDELVARVRNAGYSGPAEDSIAACVGHTTWSPCQVTVDGVVADGGCYLDGSCVLWHALGENIAAGVPLATPDAVVAGWLASPGHCVNILSPDFTEIGVGLATVDGSPYGVYWTQDFAGRP